MNDKKLKPTVLALLTVYVIFVSYLIYLKATEYTIEKFEEDAESFDIYIASNDDEIKRKINDIYLSITRDEPLFLAIVDKFTKGKYKANVGLHKNIAFLLARINYNYEGLSKNQKKALIRFFTTAIDDENLDVRSDAEWLAVQKVYEKTLRDYYIKILESDRKYLWEVATIGLYTINCDNHKIFNILQKKKLSSEFFANIREKVKNTGPQEKSKKFLLMLEKLESSQNP